MAELIFIAGETGVGKTTFIRQKYHERDRYFYFNFQRYTFHFALQKDYLEGLAAAFNQLHKEAMEAFMDGRSIVVELPCATMEQDILELFQQAKNGGIQTEWILLTLPEEERTRRMESAQHDQAYASSSDYAEEQLEILQELVTCMRMQRELVELAVLDDKKNRLTLMVKIAPDGSPLFFFFVAEGQIFLLDVDISEEMAEFDGVAPIITYKNADAMVKAALSHLNLKHLKVKMMETSWKESLSKSIVFQMASGLSDFSSENQLWN